MQHYRPVFTIFFVALLIGISFPLQLAAQTDGLLEIDGEIQRFLNRQQSAGRLSDAILSHRPLSARDARALLKSLQLTDPVDIKLRDQYLGTSSYPGAAGAQKRWSAIFKNGRDLFSAGDSTGGSTGKSTWSVQVNPILNLSAGRAFFQEDPDDRDFKNVWRSTRGFRLSGQVGSYVYLEGQFTENQEQVVDPVVEFQTAPGRPNTKLTSGGAYDWLDTRAIIGFQTSHFDIRFGRDTNLWGHGAKSTVLSNRVTAYDQVQIRLSLGRVQYNSLFFTPVEFGPETSTGFQPKKYAASHRLAIRIGQRAEIGLFETLVFGTDSLDTRSRFEFSYANPIIFLRAAERDRGSPDNAMVGLTGSFRPVNGLKLYGEFLLDEFVPENRGKGWWANKWAWQLGMHTVGLGSPRAELRLEVARMRPFLYSHKRTVNSYTNFGDLLGHPSGPNSWNLLVEARWTASRRVTFAAIADHTRQGVNTDDNLGSDPNESYTTRVHNFGNDFLQGNLIKTTLLSGMASFEILPDVHVDLSAALVSVDPEEGAREVYALPRFTLRWSSAATHFPR